VLKSLIILLPALVLLQSLVMLRSCWRAIRSAPATA
jgi:hypothetical protein